ncbi:MAG: hypothetical protein ACREAK_07080, partial [Nitrosarchaeum sp.]
MKIALFLGAGASVPFDKPVTLELKKRLIEKYPYSLNSPHYLSTFLSCGKFQDIEHVMQAIRDIKWFSESFGEKFFSDAGYGLHFHRSGDPISLKDFVKNEAEKIEKIIENEIFVNYAWNNIHDETLQQVYDQIFGILKEHS